MEAAAAEAHVIGTAPVLAEDGHFQQIVRMTPPAVDLEALRRLPVAERLLLVEDLWDSIAVDTPAPDLPMTPELVAELQRRLKDLDEGRERTFSWEEAREMIFKGKLTGP